MSSFILMAVVNSRGLYLAALNEINIYVLTRNAERSGTVTEIFDSAPLRTRLNSWLPGKPFLGTRRKDALQRYAEIERQVWLHVVMRQAASRRLNYV